MILVFNRSFRRRLRRYGFRCAAIILGLLPILILEIVLRLGGFNPTMQVDDPFVGFSRVVPLFVANQETGQYEIPASRQAFFQPEAFPLEKKSQEVRIFCLGGSTVQGRPYGPETSFTGWLDLTLSAADPTRHWQVINCGGVSYASYRLLPILEEVINYAPDLVVVYTGHNEFLEERSYDSIKHQPVWARSLHERLLGWRSYSWLRSVVNRGAYKQPKDREMLSTEVEALLDYQGGLEAYHRDRTWRAGVERHFAYNLRRMVAITREAGVPLLVINPTADLRDTPPFKAESDSRLTVAERKAFQEAWEAAKAADWENLDAKLALTEKAIEIDPLHAEPHFLLGRILEERGEYERAKKAYIRAKDKDICPLRILESMRAAIRRIAHQEQVWYLDIAALFDSLAEHGIPGNELLIDHVHPRIEGHQRIAQALFEKLVAEDWIDPVEGWQAKRREAYQQHWRTLPENYFPESVARLKGLKRWTQGRINRLKPEDN